MKKNRLLILCLPMCIQLMAAQQSGKLKLWYTKPATVWNEALPIGNGRIGAMIYGNPAKETIQLNDGTFWSGGPNSNANANALAALPTIRSLIFAGKYDEAQTMADNNIKSTKSQGATYQTIGNLNLSFAGHSAYTDYYRELNLENAVFTTNYTVDGVTYKREVFSSKPDQVIVVRLSASQAGKLTFSGSFSGPLQKTQKVINNNTLELTGLSGTTDGITGLVKFDSRIKFINKGGSMSNTSTSITVTAADEVVILISIATNFVDYKTLTANETVKCANYLAAAETQNYSDLLTSHISAYQQYFKRVSINLGTSAVSDNPTDIRLKKFSSTLDPEFVSLFYQFGRYLLISSSQPGGQAANLQGLWNGETNPTWDSKYTVNINTEMNYWPAEKTNLTEMHEPLVQMIKDLAVTGKDAAKTMYGADGWVVHHNTDIWRTAGMVDGAYWGMWPMGGAWLSQHLWEKYLYGGDKTFLNSVYPILKDACKFYQSFLVEEPVNKWLVVCPSVSPENNPSVHAASISAGTTMDNQLLFDLFTKTIKAAKILNTDSALMVDFQNILDKLAPMQIGKYGQLQEWMDDWDSTTDQNRHASHLYGLFPSAQITPYTSPELFDAARTSLIYRGDISTGWSMGWKVNFWARLLDGNHAFSLINNQLTYVDPVTSPSGGTFPNLFDAHPPFQIDGNFGCTSGITEMLLQSHTGAIHFLPALPDSWKTGEITGLRAYGGFDVDFSWENGIIQKITIKSNLGGNCRIRVPNSVALADGNLLDSIHGVNPNSFFEVPAIKAPLKSSAAKLNTLTLKPTWSYDLPTEAGKTYTLVCINDSKLQKAVIKSSNTKQILVSLTEQIKKQSTYSGFSAQINGKTVAIDSVSFVDSLNSLAVNLHNNVQSEDSVNLSYNNGNVLSSFQTKLVNFTNILVDNLLQGSAPRVVSLQSSEDGTKLFAIFNKKMILPINYDGFSVTAEYNGTMHLKLSDAAYESVDSTALSFVFSENVYADYHLLFNYGGFSAASVDGGHLKAATNVAITNTSIGLPLQVLSAKVATTGLSLTLTCNKTIAPVFDDGYLFRLTINDNVVSISDLSISGGIITLTPSQKIHSDDKVAISYAAGSIMATDKGKLAIFSNLTITNLVVAPTTWIPIPGKVEAEKYYSQYGTSSETCSDTGGGQNVGFIDTGDWLEYAVNISNDTTYIVSFRVASTSATGMINILIDNVNKGQVSFPNTTGWQVYQTKTLEMKLTKGKHYVKLNATMGGFNINWLSFEIKKSTGIQDDFYSDKVQIYPIPVKDQLVIESSEFQYKNIEIQDALGKVVFKSDVYSPKRTLFLKVPIGIYLLKLSDSKHIVVKKFVRIE